MINKRKSLSDWLKYLEQSKKKIINLVELHTVAKRLNLLKIQAFVFTVAGTNGKGTTCAMLERLLLNSGYQVGLYTSPHLMSYLERVRINGNMLSEEEHISSFKQVEFEKKNSFLTYFEFITLAALVLFKQYELDILILEVGLGGRLDATNIIDANLSIITSIGIDHTNILGNNRESIAREKSGIFRTNKIAVIGESNIPYSMIQIAKEKKTILKKINHDWFFIQNKDYWHLIHPNMQLYHLPITKIPLCNTAIALSALYYSNFKIDENIIRTSISILQVPGRFQIISSNPYVIIDVAHNPDAAIYLSKKIDNINIIGKIYAIIGILREKDIKQIILPLKNKINYWYTAPLQSFRTSNINQLKSILPENTTMFFNSIHEAYKKLKKIITKEDCIVVFGSFLTVSEFVSAMNKEDNLDLKRICG